MNWKKILIFSLATIIVLLSVEHSALYLLRINKFDYNQKIKQILNNKIDSDLTLWGSSTTLVHFNPMMIEDSLAIKSFNCALDGTNFSQYFGLLDCYVDNNKKEKDILIGLNIHGFQRREGFTRSYYWYPYLKNSYVYNTMQLTNSEISFKSRYIPFYKLTVLDKHAIKNLKSSIHQFIKGTVEKYLPIENNGFKPNYSKSLPKEDVKPYTIDLDETYISLFINKVKKYRHLGHNVYIILTPCYTKGQKSAQNLDAFYETIERISKEAKPNKIIDFLKDPICENRELFYNQTHMNAKGAEIITNKLIKNLSDDFAIYGQENSGHSN